jgi:uncharacterized membrane protein
MHRFWSNLIRGRLFNHPIHAMLVHFPSALYPLAFLFDLLGWFGGDPSFYHCSFYTLCFGVLVGYVAACFGLIDFLQISTSHVAWNKAFLHAVLNFSWLILFTIVLALKYKAYPLIMHVNVGLIISEGIGTGGMLVSNFLGGELVFTHKIGTRDTQRTIK